MLWILAIFSGLVGAFFAIVLCRVLRAAILAEIRADMECLRMSENELREECARRGEPVELVKKRAEFVRAKMQAVAAVNRTLGKLSR